MGRIFLMCQYMTGGVFQFPATPLYPKLPEATPPPHTHTRAYTRPQHHKS
jgi:hypothetical protein